MRFIFLLLLPAIYCTMNNPHAGGPVSTISPDGKIRFQDGSEAVIPHAGDPAYTIIYAVRHCEKAKDGTENPDLTPEGRARAEKLGRALDALRLDRICTTNYKRTFQTGEAVKPFAGDPPMETFPPDMQDAWLDELLQGGAGKQYLYVGHQNTVPQLLNRLAGATRFANIRDNEFGRLYIVATKGIGQSEVLELYY